MPTNDDPTNNPGHNDPVDPGLTIGGEPFDDVAGRAGRELRRPAPREGLDQIHRSHRRRRTTNAMAGGAAAIILIGGGILLATRDNGSTLTEIQPAGTTDSTAPPEVVVSPDPTTGPTIDPPVETPPEETPPVETPPVETSLPAPIEPTVSDEILPDPLAFAADGVERELVGRDLVVRSTPEQLIPLDLTEPEIWLYGVGPNGVAYLRADADGLARIVAVPTSGPNTGAVYELVAPYPHEGPWLGWMTPSGIDTMDLASNTTAAYVDTDGQALADPIDPTFTWSVDYRFVDEDFSVVHIVAVDLATGNEFELPETEPAREGQIPREVRPLPDGRITVQVISADGESAVWALTPATGVWTQHPSG